MLLPHLAQDARIVDVGSGAGLPAIPCAIARADLRAFLIESSRKKAVFLREAVRQLDLHQRAEVSANRFERIAAPEAEAVTSRALDRFQELLPSLIQWAPPGITLLLFGGENLLATIKSLLPSAQVERMPNSERRFLIVASRPESA
jgi:16S rRNA (guanine527-N7)-methyltransferase